MKTECYQCGDKTTALKGAVHPLCDSCQEEHNYWFLKQVSMFDRAKENATNA